MDIITICRTSIELSALKHKMMKQSIEYISEYLNKHDGKFEFNDGEFYYESLKGLSLNDGKPCFIFVGGYTSTIESFLNETLACNVCFHLNKKELESKNNAGHIE